MYPTRGRRAGDCAVRRLGSGHHTMVAREPLRVSATREAGFTAAAGALASTPVMRRLRPQRDLPSGTCPSRGPLICPSSEPVTLRVHRERLSWTRARETPARRTLIRSGGGNGSARRQGRADHGCVEGNRPRDGHGVRTRGRGGHVVVAQAGRPGRGGQRDRRRRPGRPPGHVRRQCGRARPGRGLRGRHDRPAGRRRRARSTTPPPTR